MDRNCYRMFLRLIKTEQLYFSFKKCFSNEELTFLKSDDSLTFLSRFHGLISEKFRNGNINAANIYIKIPKIINQYNRLVNEYTKIIAHDFFKSRLDLKLIIDCEIKKSDWNKYTNIDEAIENSSEVSYLISRLFDWAETKNGVSFWNNIEIEYLKNMNI